MLRKEKPAKMQDTEEGLTQWYLISDHERFAGKWLKRISRVPMFSSAPRAPFDSSTLDPQSSSSTFLLRSDTPCSSETGHTGISFARRRLAAISSAYHWGVPGIFWTPTVGLGRSGREHFHGGGRCCGTVKWMMVNDTSSICPAEVPTSYSNCAC